MYRDKTWLMWSEMYKYQNKLIVDAWQQSNFMIWIVLSNREWKPLRHFGCIFSTCTNMALKPGRVVNGMDIAQKWSPFLLYTMFSQTSATALFSAKIYISFGLCIRKCSDLQFLKYLQYNLLILQALTTIILGENLTKHESKSQN